MAESERSERTEGAGRPRRRAVAKKTSEPLPVPGFAHPALQWVQRNPKTALAIALGVGLAIGMSPRLRRGVVNGMSKVGELMSE